MQRTTDQQLIERTLSGDSRAFGTLVENYQGYVYTIVLRMVKVKEEAEEVAQDTFVKAYESLSSFRGDSKFSSWLYSIAYRKALDRIRKNKRHKASELIEEITSDEIGVGGNVHQLLESKERSAQIQECIMQLPEVDAALVTLYYFEEQSVKEIAKITQLSEENIKVKLYRTRKKMFSLLEHLISPEIPNGHGKYA
ncbi:MAG: RNA polymerase sigma factor [Bacteroidota bacterium]